MRLMMVMVGQPVGLLWKGVMGEGWMRHYWISSGSRLPCRKRHSACNYGNMVLASCLHRPQCHRVAKSTSKNTLLLKMKSCIRL